ncbi:hypothetical protein FRC11_006795, partial [Ceratobasidium sp. 423]
MDNQRPCARFARSNASGSGTLSSGAGVLPVGPELALAFLPSAGYSRRYNCRTLWGGLYSFVTRVKTTDAGGKVNPLPAQREEREILSNASPDRLTAEAVLWLVSHSENDSLVDATVQATAGVIAGPEFWDFLVTDRFVAIVAQRFIAFCQTILPRMTNGTAAAAPPPDDLPPMTAYYCRVLAKVAQHSNIQLVQATGTFISLVDVSTKSKHIRLTRDLFEAVEQGVYRLIECDDAEVKAAGFCAASAWYTSTGRTSHTNKKRGPLLTEIINFLINRDPAPNISDELLVNLVGAIAVEVSHMRGELEEELMKKSLQSVIDLCDLRLPDKAKLLEGPARGAMSATLAVVSTLLNDYQRDAEGVFYHKEDQFSLYTRFQELQSAYIQQYRYTTGAWDSRSTYWRPWLAQWVAQICTKYPEYLEANASPLLLFGLSGVLRSFRTDSTQAARLAELFGAQLESASVADTEPIRLPFILSRKSDVLERIGDDIYTAILARPYDSGYVNMACIPPESKASMLRRLRTNGLWIKFGPPCRLLTDILHLSQASDDQSLQSQCVITLNHYWFMRSATGQIVYSPPDWRLFISLKVVPIWVKGFRLALTANGNNTSGDELRSSTISCFVKLARTINIQKPTSNVSGQSQVNQPATASQPQSSQAAGSQPNPQGTTHAPNGGNGTNFTPLEILEVLKKLLLHDKELFEIFAKDIACADSSDADKAGLGFWRDAICSLPSELNATPAAQTWAANTSNQVHPGPTSSVPTPGANSQVLPVNTGPQLSTTNFNAQASGSQTAAASSGSQTPAVGSNSQIITPAVATNPNARAFTSSNSQTSTSSSSAVLVSSSATSVQSPPMTYDEAREWLRTFANNNVNEGGDLGKMAKDLRDALDKTDG